MTDRSVATSETRSLVRRLASWVSQDVDVAEYVALVRQSQTCRRTKAAHGGPLGLIHPLPLPTRCGGMIGVDWIAGLPTTAAGFDMIQNHVNLLLGKVHAVPTRATLLQRARQRSSATCVSAQDPGSLTYSLWITTPSSRARFSGPS